MSRETEIVLMEANDFFGLPSPSLEVPKVKPSLETTPYGQPSGDQYVQPLQPNIDPYGQPLQQSINPYGQPYDQLPIMAKISGNILDGVSKFIDYIWYYFVGVLNRFINNYGDSPGCFMFPSINFNNPSISVRFERCQICGVANAYLSPMLKTIGPYQWNATSNIEFRDMTMTFGSFYIFSPVLPWPFSKINLESVQFHFDRINLKTSIVVPFQLLVIPTSFHVYVEDMDNFVVNFLTPNPSMKQKLMATSMQKSAKFVLNTILDILSSVLSLPNLLTKITSFSIGGIKMLHFHLTSPNIFHVINEHRLQFTQARFMDFDLNVTGFSGF
uniref:Uncharacterized protein n=1 Tax=Lygus hesperus TaxID=30085 RepID=A0A0K8S6A8_LYGHE